MQFDVCRNANAATAATFPLLLDVQSDLLDRLATRVVIPMMTVGAFGVPIDRLNPVFDINGDRYVAVTTELAGVRRDLLGERVAAAADRRDEVIAALDFLLQGF